MRRSYAPVLLALFPLLFLSLLFLQHLVLPLIGAVGGSFGIRPVSHGCLGLTVRESSALFALLPYDDIEIGWPVHVRYMVGEKDSQGHRAYCIGQDVWFGE